MADPRIVRIEWGQLEGRRPRHAGCNARLGEHGIVVRPAIARITADDGAIGWGASRITREQAAKLVGSRLSDVFVAGKGASRAGLPLEFPLWDLAGKRAGEPVYAMAAATVGATPATPFRVQCYDTSLYFDDLHLESEQEAAALIAAEAREGYARGHRAFKMKVGRGARHMELAAGLRRDIAVVHAVREAVGEHATLMTDANNGYNLNLAKQLLRATADADVFWLEEAFHEDDVLYSDFQAWLRAEGLSTLIADGEGLASPRLLEMARQRLVNVVQYDIFSYGFTRWLELGAQLDRWGARTAPHHYGGHYGNYTSGHLAAAIGRFAFVEWDEASTPGLDGSAYFVSDGWVTVPHEPGFGVGLEEGPFREAVATNGFTVSAGSPPAIPA